MAYFTLNNVDISKYVSALNITTKHNYIAQANAAGDNVVDYINAKRQITVEIRPMEEDELKVLVNAIAFTNTISYRKPAGDGALESVNCIIDGQGYDYYTIQQYMIRYKKFKLVFNEL